ncbi:hypothetical protein ACVWW6_008776 [Bradyrhizobium sp. USDA 3311]
MSCRRPMKPAILYEGPVGSADLLGEHRARPDRASTIDDACFSRKAAVGPRGASICGQYHERAAAHRAAWVMNNPVRLYERCGSTTYDYVELGGAKSHNVIGINDHPAGCTKESSRFCRVCATRFRLIYAARGELNSLAPLSKPVRGSETIFLHRSFRDKNFTTNCHHRRRNRRQPSVCRCRLARSVARSLLHD